MNLKLSFYFVLIFKSILGNVKFINPSLFKVSYALFESGLEKSACLPNILLISLFNRFTTFHKMVLYFLNYLTKMHFNILWLYWCFLINLSTNSTLCTLLKAMVFYIHFFYIILYIREYLKNSVSRNLSWPFYFGYTSMIWIVWDISYILVDFELNFDISQRLT